MSLSSVGIGSGVLTSDLLDKLRAADETSTTSRTQNQLDLVKFQQTAMKSISDMMDLFQDSLETLQDPKELGMKTFTTSSDTFKISLDAATTDVENISFSFEVSQLAKGAVKSSDTFSTDEALGKDGIININGTDITYTATTTLRELADKIDDTNLDVNATVLRIGDNEFQLMLSGESGYGNEINIQDDNNLLGTVNDLQSAQNALATFNGQPISSSTNTFKPLEGVSIIATREESTNISISTDTEKLNENLEKFTFNYNNLMSTIREATKSSADLNTRGVLNNNSQVKGLQRFLEDLKNNFKDIGFSGNRGQDLTFSLEDLDLSKLTEFSENFEETFNKVNQYNKYNGIIDRMEDSLETREKSYQKMIESQKETLDARYDTMKANFIVYDSIINKLNSVGDMFTSLMNPSD